MRREGDESDKRTKGGNFELVLGFHPLHFSISCLDDCLIESFLFGSQSPNVVSLVSQ